MEPTSTAKRVASIVETLTRSSTGWRIGEALAYQFGTLAEGEMPDSLVRIAGSRAWAEFLSATVEALHECEECSPENRPTVTVPFENLSRHLSGFSSDHTLQQVTGGFDVSSLKLAATAITLELRSTRPDASQLSAITSDLQSLLERVEESLIDPTLKALLALELARLRSAIVVFNVCGSAAVESAANKATGNLVRVLLGTPTMQEEAKSAFVESILFISRAVGEVQAVGQFFPALPAAAAQLLRLTA